MNLTASLPRFFGILAVLCIVTSAVRGAEEGEDFTPPGLVRSEFLFEEAPFEVSHASTIVETPKGLLVSWIGGSAPRSLDSSVWISWHDGKKWSGPALVANGMDEEKRLQHPAWNPVLFQPKRGPLLLFYKIGPNPESWRGMLMTSEDGGRSWMPAKRLPDGIFGPIKNKPIELLDNVLLCGSSAENAGWRVHVERTRTFGRSWTRTEPINRALDYSAIQPSLLQYPGGRIQMLCRTKQQKITESWSEDNGQTWGRMMPTSLPNPNGAIDAVMLRDGRALLVYHHSTSDRGVLNVALTSDGKNWDAAMVLENEPGSEFSYPAVIQTADGLVHVTYSWKKKRIKHVVLDPFRLPAGRPIVEGNWPG